ncbi:hypothetical protein Lser_V15G09608 [Lactuca serriola]
MSLPSQTPPPSVHKTLPKSFSDFIFSAFSLFNLYSSTPNLSSSYNHHRRFSKLPIIPLTKNAVINQHHFSTPQSLSDWLRPRLPSDSFAAWGTRPGTKNIHNLWIELYEGETSLADSIPPVRTVEVVVVRVRDERDRILIESHQELSNGHVRNRSRPLSEKMKPAETVEEAVARAVKEELGSIINGSCEDEIVEIIPGSYSSKVEEKLSVSYPGLPACYVLHTVDALVHGLPDCEFCTIEEENNEIFDGMEVAEGAVSCKKHYWKWVDSI